MHNALTESDWSHQDCKRLFKVQCDIRIMRTMYMCRRTVVQGGVGSPQEQQKKATYKPHFSSSALSAVCSVFSAACALYAMRTYNV